MRRYEGLTPLVGGMYRDNNGRLSPDPPIVAVLERPRAATPSEDELRRISSLGGDYVGLIIHLTEYIRHAHSGPNFARWKPALVIALAPNRSDETRGLIGTFGLDRACHVVLVASREQALATLRAACDLGHHAAERAAEAVPLFERSVLPETSAEPIVDLPAELATWLVGWYALYAFDTKKIG